MRGARVVVCDDETLIRLWLQAELGKVGCRTEGAPDGTALLAALEREPADLVLLDVRLPDTSGVELLPRLRRLYPGLPVIIITAYGDPETAGAALAGGALCVLEKPLETEELLPAVEQALGGGGAG